MSKPQFDAFFNKLMGDKALRDKVSAIVADRKIKNVHAEVAKVATAAGFAVTTEDVVNAQVSLKPKGKLSDADLDRIAGGKRKDHDCESVCGTCCGEFLGTWVGQQ